MRWLPLDSKAFRACSYTLFDRTLYLEFQSGERYRYFGVPPETYCEFLQAESHGRYFQQYIFNRFEYELLPRVQRAS